MKKRFSVSGDNYVHMPLLKNVPNPIHEENWKLVNCPVCGADCWETEFAREVEHLPNYIRSCSKCSLDAIRGTV